MADTRPPDYEKYTKSVTSDISKRQQGAKAYARKGSKGELDFTAPIRRNEPGTDWLYVGRGNKSREQVRKKFNRASAENKEAYRKEYQAREAFDKGDTGIPKIESRKSARKSKRGRRKSTR